jgi:hypothetical protein
MINGIVLLLSTTPGSSQRSGYVQGAGLLFTALVTLGLDSYLFGLVTGDTAAQACRRAWTAAMFAAGLLGLGAVAVIVAVVFLMGVFFWEATAAAELAQSTPLVPDPQSSPAEAAQVASGEKSPKEEALAGERARADRKDLDKSKEMLAALCTWLRLGVAVIMISFLWITARSYLSSIFDDHPPNWAVEMLTSILVVEYVVIVIFAGVYLWVSKSGSGKSAIGRVPTQESAPIAAPTGRFQRLSRFQKFAFVPASGTAAAIRGLSCADVTGRGA